MKWGLAFLFLSTSSTLYLALLKTPKTILFFLLQNSIPSGTLPTTKSCCWAVRSVPDQNKDPAGEENYKHKTRTRVRNEVVIGRENGNLGIMLGAPSACRERSL